MSTRLYLWQPVQIHERPQLDVMLSDLFLVGLKHSNNAVELRNLQDMAPDKSFDGLQAAPSIDGAEGLVVTADDGDDDVDAGCLAE